MYVHTGWFIILWGAQNYEKGRGDYANWSRITLIILISMYEWKLSAAVKDCVGVGVHADFQYSLLLKLGNKFSPPLPAGQVASTGISFNANLELEFSTASGQLPASNLQLLLVGGETMLSPRGINTRKEHILAIATLPLAYPLPHSLALPATHRFDKPADSKANIRVAFSLARAGPSPTSRRTRSPSPVSPSSSPAKSQVKGEEASPRKSRRREEQLEQIQKERNELYKMSESLYEELKKCMAERDQYLRELRERELSEQQIREEMEFLKLKLQEEHAEHHDRSPLLQEMDELRCENEEMRTRLADREADLKELERRVKESLIAMDEFRREAVSARTDLIHKESELSLISRHAKQLDPAECIQQLFRELENRRYEEPFFFEEVRYEVHSPAAKAAERVRRAVAQLVTQVMGRLKTPRDREWLVQQKVALERKVEQILHQC